MIDQQSVFFQSRRFFLGLIFVGIAIAFSILIIQNFSSPLSGMVGLGPLLEVNHDFVDIQEYNGFYFAKNLRFNPFPQLNLVNNQVFYPYGTNNVFNPWLIEGDYFYAVLYTWFGTGPWLQIYYLSTVLIAAIGTIVLLKPDYGLIRAFGVGLIVSFGNVYAVHKYPHHLQDAVIHWMTLSVIVDFLIVKKAVLKQPIALRLLLIRLCLLFLSIGHDLGYIAGYGLTSLVISLLFIAGLLIFRRFKQAISFQQTFQDTIASYQQEFFANRVLCIVLLGVAALAGFLYVPLAFQIAIAAKSFDFSGVDFGPLWINPVRLLLPIFPVFQNPRNTFEGTFRDSPEAAFAANPGWFLIILGAIALWQNRSQLAPFIPLLVLFGACLFYIPGQLFSPYTLQEAGAWSAVFISLWCVRKQWFLWVPCAIVWLVILYFQPTLFLVPTLQLFPWATFNRVSGRSTVLYPVILSLLALHLNGYLHSRKQKWLAIALVGLACIELGTAYSFRFSYQQPTPLNRDFFAYMETVKQQPGEAVLDFPFCIASGGGARSICPYYFSNSGIFALRRFHEKKVMGQYFGRLHESQVAPYFEAGWDKLFVPDRTFFPNRQARCFNAAEWTFFSEFFKLNDFAGINLYTDRLPQQCTIAFHEKFGRAIATTTIPGAGNVEFIPKAPELRNQVNVAAGLRLRLNE
jgi:hypothetical protein